MQADDSAGLTEELNEIIEELGQSIEFWNIS